MKHPITYLVIITALLAWVAIGDSWLALVLLSMVYSIWLQWDA